MTVIGDPEGISKSFTKNTNLEKIQKMTEEYTNDETFIMDQASLFKATSSSIGLYKTSFKKKAADVYISQFTFFQRFLSFYLLGLIKLIINIWLL